MAIRNLLLATAAIFASTAAFAGDHSVGKGGVYAAPVVEAAPAPVVKHHHGKRHHHHVKKVVKTEEIKKEEVKK